MSDQPVRLTQPPEGYAEWLFDLKSRIQTAQQRATLAVNRELVLLYWHIGRDILERQAQQGWGAKVIERLSEDLRSAFPEMKGFSRANLMYMRAFAEAWPDALIVQQAVGQLPWGHNLVILTRLKDPQQRLAYAQSAIDKVVAEYALRDKSQPIGVAEYQLVESLPPELITNLPSIEHIERELANDPRSMEKNPP